MNKVLIPIASIVFLISPLNRVWAEISTPYVIDEKSKVTFGDSTIIAPPGYVGLQNYVADYVGGYLHFTFTYTHHGCCTAAYPPGFYVTDIDPTATTTQIVRDFHPIFSLNQQPTHLTDWYLYEAQFDSTGYTAVVKKAGETEVFNSHRDIPNLTSTDWAALANTYPRQDPLTDNSMSFTPLHIREFEPETEPQVVATTTPVIIVPGIMGSYLNNANNLDEEIWMNVVSMALSLSDSYLESLYLNQSGVGTLDLEATDIIRKINIPVFSRDLFDSLINTLSSHNYSEGSGLFVFPYDWRFNISDIADRLDNQITKIKNETGSETVNIVSHSMGGLVFKEYLRKFGGDSVSKFVDVATPHLGAPKSFLTLDFGSTDISILNNGVIKSISQNMPSIYELLPSRSYLGTDEYYVWNGVTNNNRLSFEATKDYLKSEGRNATLVDLADEFHQELDGLDPADYGVETYNIVGCGVPTLGKFYILDDSPEHPVYNISFVDGDGTVPLKSAEAISAEKTFYVTGSKHALLPSFSGVKDLVAELLSSTSTDTLNFSQFNNVSLSPSGCGIPNGKVVSIHSPVDLNIYDEEGNHAGPDSSGDIENNIAGVEYEVLGDNKFAFLPDGSNYSISGIGTGDGSFSAWVESYSNGEVVDSTSFDNLPISSGEKLALSLSSVQDSHIAIDADDDGDFELVYQPTSTSVGVIVSIAKPSESGEPDGGGTPNTPMAPEPSFNPVSHSLGRSSTSNSRSSLVVAQPVVNTNPVSISVSYPINKNVVTEKPMATSTSETKVQPVALAQKAAGNKVTGFLKSLWGWFVSKL